MLNPSQQTQLDQICQKEPLLSPLLRTIREEHQFQLSQFSHEIRNPITLINSYMQLTEQRYPQVCSFDTWPQIQENMKLLRLLLDDLSSYNNAFRLHKEEFSLTWFLDALITSCKPAIAPVSIFFEKNGAIPTGAFDRSRLHCAILNLLRNASEALHGQEDGWIRVSLSFDGESFHLSVRNNGPEIPSEQIPDLFHPFVTHKTDGTGLGLAIVQRVIQAHEGTITVTSDPSETCFSMTLPLLYL